MSVGPANEDRAKPAHSRKPRLVSGKPPEKHCAIECPPGSPHVLACLSLVAVEHPPSSSGWCLLSAARPSRPVPSKRFTLRGLHTQPRSTALIGWRRFDKRQSQISRHGNVSCGRRLSPTPEGRENAVGALTCRRSVGIARRGVVRGAPSDAAASEDARRKRSHSSSRSSAGRPTTTAAWDSTGCRASPTRWAYRFTRRSRTAARRRGIWQKCTRLKPA